MYVYEILLSRIVNRQITGLGIIYILKKINNNIKRSKRTLPYKNHRERDKEKEKKKKKKKKDAPVRTIGKIHI